MCVCVCVCTDLQMHRDFFADDSNQDRWKISRNTANSRNEKNHSLSKEKKQKKNRIKNTDFKRKPLL